MNTRMSNKWVGLLLVMLLAVGTTGLADGLAAEAPAAVQGVVDHPVEMTLEDLPAPYAETALALQANLADQFSIIARAEVADLALTKAGNSFNRADTTLATAELALLDAQGVLADAQTAVAEQEDLLAQLTAMRDLHAAQAQSQAEYDRVLSADQKANETLDNLLDELTSAHALYEETNAELVSKQESLQEMQESMDSLEAQIKTPAENADVKTLTADLKAAQTAYEALEEQVKLLQADVDIIAGQIDQLSAQQEDANTAQQEATTALEDATDALKQAQAALETVQLTVEEINQAEEAAKLALLKAQTALDQAQAAMSTTQADRDAKAALQEQAAQALEAAQAEKEEADAAHEALQARWAAYADIPGTITEDAHFPAMDLIACADVEESMIVIHSTEHSLYFFEDGVLVDTQARRARDGMADVTLTRTNSGHVALRYTHESGKTRMQVLADDAQILFTGEYAIVRVSDTMRGTVTYLGSGCMVSTVNMPPVAALVDLGQDDTLRYVTERLFESHQD